MYRPGPVHSAEDLWVLARAYADRAPGYRVPPRLVAASLRLKVVRDLFSGAPHESIRYLNHPVRFDTRRAQQLLEGRGLRCPRLDEYVAPLVRFFREHEDDGAYAPAQSH